MTITMTEEDLEGLLPEIQTLVRRASRVLMVHYERYLEDSGDLDVELKADNSPVTSADKAAHRLIVNALQALTPDIPVISEENAKHPDIPEDGLFWTVDPLDGTKGFIGKTGGFYVKIALLDGFKPVLGVIGQPVKDVLYHSVEGGKAYVQDKNGHDREISTNRTGQSRPLKTVFNELHHDPQAYEAAKDYLRARGLDIPDKDQAHGKVSTVFNMAVAQGEMDAYLDCGGQPSLENGNGFSWDYAPDWLILKNAGGIMVELLSGKEPVFHRPTERMNAMISLGDKELGKRRFPKLENDCVSP